ncbi:MAG: response regulator [Actinobacteria bacterium]|nr:response regulator [Actinomycetota bacterium]MCG2819626.1 response regulator [Actinomycetes bacterium]MBU4217408.1 response regulator [Actinomycetota bacterium]MBU4359970.1 response regulator [Actinomycetota bacterium]MBU4393168.1 response regulator [Actinomycetota bacterium]
MKKVLLVDDDRDFVESTRAVLEEKYEVIVAYDGDEGIEKVKSERPDLIILDVIMPTEDGFSAAEQLKNDPEFSDIPVIMLTSFGTRMSKETQIPRSRGFDLQAEDYIEKPVKPDELLRHAEELLS